MRNLLILLSSILLLTASCVSTRPANNINKAEKRIIKYNTGIQNQIKQFPSLVDKAYKITETIYVPVPSNTLRLNLLLQELEKLNSIQSDYEVKYDSVNLKLDSLKVFLSDSTIDLNDHRHVVFNLLDRIQILNKENKILFDKYTKLASIPQSGTYEDDKFNVFYIFKDGVISLDIKTKYKEIPIDVITDQHIINIKRHFWQDFKFWGFIITLINILYFFNSLIYNFLDSIFTGIIKFVRKLFIKI